jgi:hypothetical protein
MEVCMLHRSTVFLLAALLTVAGVARAQSGPTGLITGQVLDVQSLPLAEVGVTATHEGTGATRTVTTNAEGLYTIPALPIGQVRLEFRKQGYQTISRAGTLVEAAVPRTVNVTLQPGAVEATVSVTTESSPLQTATAAVSRRLSSAELVEVPTSTRNFTHLLTATAGVSADLPPVSTNDTGSISPSVNGTKTTSNSVLFNGVDITSMLSNIGTLDEGLVPALETIDEVKLQTSMYDATAGRSGGGNFQLITKAGTNTMAGSLYLFGQHERFNANDFFFQRAGLAKPVARRNEGGFTVGGPLRRDRAFVYGSFQQTSARTGYVPTASSRAVLPAALGLIDGARTADNIVAAFKAMNPGFTLTPAQISPLAIALLNATNPATGGFLIPAPNGATAGTDRRVAIGPFGSIGGDPLAELRQVVPAEFDQRQGSVRTDFRLSDTNQLSVSYFGSDFPSLDPFPDPSTLVSPATLRRSNRGHVVSVGQTSLIGANVVNEVRAGVFTLRNTRRLDDGFGSLEGSAFGIANPALLFDDRDATRRLGHFVNRAVTWSFGGPNDAYNRREQLTVHVGDTVTLVRGSHTLRLGGDFKSHAVNTNLPEEQATEFEKIENFQQFLLGFTSEADTQFGFTDKAFRSYDAALYVSDDWRVSNRLTVNLGLRWDWFGWPYEKNGYLGNFDPALVTDSSNPITGLVVPSNVAPTGIPQVDSAIALAPRTSTKHTLNGEDLNNLAPRIGFAWTPRDTGRVVIRGGYGLFYDRPSAAFMNTVFSNYPFLREVEITRPTAMVPIQNAFATNTPGGVPPGFERFFPFQLVFAGNSYTLFDGTGLNRPNNNSAETLEYRAVDRNLETPFYQQWNLSYGIELPGATALEVRYNGSRGHNLLLSTALNEPWDLNDPATPQEIKDRITAAYRAGGGTANAADSNALGYGYVNPATGLPDLNFGPGNRLISSEVRAPYFGMNDAEALFLRSAGRSQYHALQVSLTRRFSRGVQIHGAYTFSRSMDLFSADPGSTAGGGRPDTPNTGFSVENDSRNLEANWAVSDFDRPHRLSVSAVWHLPNGSHELLRDWQVATVIQTQSGRPFSVFVPEAGLLRLGFQRLDFAPGHDGGTAATQGADPVDAWFNVDALQEAGGAGNTPRNFLRGPAQKRVDLSITKRISLGRAGVELRAEIFNLFNTANLGLPENNFTSSDFGRITNTVGGPRVSQFGARLTF